MELLKKLILNKDKELVSVYAYYDHPDNSGIINSLLTTRYSDLSLKLTISYYDRHD